MGAVLVLGVVFGAVGYWEASTFGHRNGVTPWRWPAPLWGVICFASVLIGAILLLIARRTTKPSGAGPWQYPYLFIPAQPGNPWAPPVPAPRTGGDVLPR